MKVSLGKLQITILKFGDTWLLHFEVLEFEFYLPKVLGWLDFTPRRFKIWMLIHKI